MSTTNPILAAIAARLGRRPLPGDQTETRFAVLKDGAEAAVAPAMAEDSLAFFRAQAEKNLFEISEVTDLATAVAGLRTELPLALSPQSGVQALPWRQCGFAFCDDPRAPALAIVAAVAGIAETGTVAVGSREAPSALLFLAEELLVILSKRDVVPLQDDLWRRLGPVSQRALHLISGPSRTADVEQTLQVGAHGPRRVYLWLVD